MMATEMELLFTEKKLIDIKSGMLLLQMLKHRRDGSRSLSQH